MLIQTNTAPVTNTKINATYLDNHFNQSSDQESTRLKVFAATLLQCTYAEVATACRDWSNGYKGSPKRATVQVRCSEVKSLKSATDTGKFRIETEQTTKDKDGVDHISAKGWHANVADARAILVSLNLTNSGKPVVDRAQRNAYNKTVALAVKTLELAKNDVSKMADVANEAAIAIEKETAKKLASVVVQKHGIRIAEFCAEYLLDMIQEIAQNEANAAEKAKADHQSDDSNTDDVVIPEAMEAKAA